MAEPTHTLLSELTSLRRARGSRRFDVCTDDLTTSLLICEGELVTVMASKPGEPIGRILRRKRMITREHYVEVLDGISEVLAAGDNVRFGEVAVGLGYAKAEDVAECLAEQVRGLVARIFQSASPTWTTRAVPIERDSSRDVTMHIEAIFLDALRWLDNSRKGALGLDAARMNALQPAWDLAEIDERFELTPDEAEFVRVALAGQKTVTELFVAGGSAEVDAHAVLTALLATGAASTRAPGALPRRSKPPKARSMPALPAWTTVDARTAKQAVAKVFKARASSPAMRAIGTLLEQTLEAEQAFQRGRELFRANDVKSALPFFERAVACDPASAEYVLFVEWSRHHLREEVLTPDVRAELTRHARNTLDDNPKLAFGYFVLGDLLCSEGKVEEGRVQLMHALRLDKELFDGVRKSRRDALRASGRDGEAAEEPFSSDDLPRPDDSNAPPLVAAQGATAREAAPTPPTPASLDLSSATDVSSPEGAMATEGETASPAGESTGRASAPPQRGQAERPGLAQAPVERSHSPSPLRTLFLVLVGVMIGAVSAVAVVEVRAAGLGGATRAATTTLPTSPEVATSAGAPARSEASAATLVPVAADAGPGAPEKRRTFAPAAGAKVAR